MTLEKFESMLINHDWSYQYADDHSYYSRGAKQASAISSVLNSKTDEPEYLELYKKLKKC